jgi:hypothetical protein
MKFIVETISSSVELQKNATEWDAFVQAHSDNPFLLTNFMIQAMEQRELNVKPLLVVLRVDKEIVAIAPLALIKKAGLLSARFLLQPDFSPDFILITEYNHDSFKVINNFLFKRINCAYISLAFDNDSSSFKTYVEEFEPLIVKYPGHLLLRAPNSSDDLKKILDKRLRRDFRQTERLLSTKQSWSINQYSNILDSKIDALKNKVLKIEKASWKAIWRHKHKVDSDSDLIALLNSFSSAIKSSFIWFVWILEIEELPVSFQIAIKFKNKVYFVKTAFANSYRRFSPGIYIFNTGVIESLKDPNIREIDFMTDKQFLRRWETDYIPRTGVIITNKTLPTLAKYLLANFLKLRGLKKLANLLLIYL